MSPVVAGDRAGCVGGVAEGGCGAADGDLHVRGVVEQVLGQGGEQAAPVPGSVDVGEQVGARDLVERLAAHAPEPLGQLVDDGLPERVVRFGRAERAAVEEVRVLVAGPGGAGRDVAVAWAAGAPVAGGGGAPRLV